MKNKNLGTLLLALPLMTGGLSQAAPQADIIIDNNFRLRGEILSFTGEKVVLKHHAIKENVHLLPTGISSVYFYGDKNRNITAKDKIFLANKNQDIIPCTIMNVTQNEVKYKDMFGQVHTAKRNQVAGFRINALKEKGYWQEPLIPDNSWVTENKQEDDMTTSRRKKLVSTCRPEILPDGSYIYRLNRTKYQTWARLHKDIGLNPTSFIFTLNCTIDADKNSNNANAILYCFGGNAAMPFRSNYSNSSNRLLLGVSPTGCRLLREQKSGMAHLGEIRFDSNEISKGLEIKLISSHNGTHQTYELLVGNKAPLVIKDTSKEPLEGNAFGFQFEGYYNINITKMGLSALTLSSQSIRKNDKLQTDLVMTNEEDAIPCHLISYDAAAQMLALETDKEYPGIPRRLNIPTKYLDTIFFNSTQTATKKTNSIHGILMNDGSKLYGTVQNITADKLELKHPELGILSLPLNNITRVEFINPAAPTRSTP